METTTAILIAWLVLTLITAFLYGADWLSVPGEMIWPTLVVVLFVIGLIWPISLPFFMVAQSSKGGPFAR